MSPMASQITSLTIVYSTVYSGADQRKHQSSASLAFVRGIHRWPVNSPHKGPMTRKMFPFNDVIMWWFTLIPFASWFLLPALPLNYALSCSENGLVPQERIKTIFSQNKPIFKQKMSLKIVSAKYRPFVGTGATYTISLEICTRIGCALFCCGHNIIDSWHTFYWLGLLWDLTHWFLGDLNKEIKKQFCTSFSD